MWSNYCIWFVTAMKNCEVIKQLNVGNKTSFKSWKMFQEKQITSPNPIPGRIRSVQCHESQWRRGWIDTCMRKRAIELDISDRSLKRIAEVDLGLKPYKILRRQLLSSTSKQKKSLGRKKKALAEMQHATDSLRFGPARSFSLWKLWSTTKTRGFTLLHQDTSPRVSEHILSGRNQLVSWFRVLLILMVRNRLWCLLKKGLKLNNRGYQ